MEEKVLVVPKNKCLFEVGFHEAKLNELLNLIKQEGKFIDRSIAEYDFNFYQIIPYIVIKQENMIFYTRRLKRQSESRLHEKLSIGVGGHINDVDGKIEDVVLNGLKRELEEELIPFNHSEPIFVGTLVDNSNEVSQVHLGLVFIINTNDDVKIKEINKMSGSFTNIEFLKSKIIYEKLETWSQILIDKM